MRTESAQSHFAEDADRVESAPRIGSDMRQRNAVLLVPPSERLPEGWQIPWVNAGWSVSHCSSSERIPAALHGPGASALVVSPWAEIGKPSLSGTVARGLVQITDALRADGVIHGDAALAVGGMLRRAAFLAHLDALMNGEEKGCCALMAIQVDQAQALVADLDRTTVFDLEEQFVARIAETLDRQDVTTIWLEFGFGVLVQRASADEVVEVANRVRAAVADAPFRIGDAESRATVSVGLALAPRGCSGSGSHQWFASAHAAQGIASRHGGNRCEGLLTREFEPIPAERVLIIREWVREARGGGNIQIDFQPLMPLRPQAPEFYSVHAKLRDYRAPLGGVYRDEYRRIACDADAMVMIDRTSLFHAFETLQQEHARGRTTQLLVPIEMDTLKDLPWRWLEAELQRRKHLLDRLVVELEASPLLLDKDSVKRIVRLRRSGIRLCLADCADDLQQVPTWAMLPADMLRVRYAAVASEDAESFARMVAAWHAKGRGLIVDGVEDTRALAQLSSLGVDHLRGHALGAIGPRLDHDFTAA
jgi:EAL domain-containing protein (putative c-di-GMP-specific phosphodiesterase class I)/GGDEF domain-containing protein